MLLNSHQTSSLLTGNIILILALLSPCLDEVLSTTIPNTPQLPYFTSKQTLPQYALDFAPLVYLHSQEVFWPSDLNRHLDNVQPQINFTTVESYLRETQTTQDFLGSSNLQRIPPSQQEITYLSSKNPIFDLDYASWLRGAGPPDKRGRSSACAIIIAVDKTQQVGPGWVDVFYLFFYSYNRGNYFNGNRFGDHVGDWENTMIRFKNGKPMYVAPEAHGGRVMLGDSAFNYNVLEHLNGRPVVYAANGTHGMYPQPGQQNYTGLPVAIYDVTDKGHLWDPTLNYKSFFFSNEHGFSYTADTPLKLQSRQRLGWLRFLGYWGDQKPELSNPHQTCIGTMCFYEGGPLGPQSKSLSRGWICGSSDCQPQSTLPTMFRPGGQRANSPYSSSWTNRLNFLSGVLLILLTAYAIHLT
ncbi:Vacuolar protein sorting-associated protein 62 [Puccinia graminis f. sp. tritici]|uniref:Vacuolar protein sorting-associated protein 62 n=1 Tax=Puccinia graminis f. sp. tritici TaxID=56615 RepID=A0A5B0PTD8_PUCGR|nr:Vacuolar protein sorting-associated protein 62 [Puccinia graminis f. sp. tritici]KAA1104571.1 Vacuolar protein sorting-associated protein 62 [Puccinia graminis f. sp. tritici]